jgi:cell division protein FtsB
MSGPRRVSRRLLANVVLSLLVVVFVLTALAQASSRCR